MVRTYRIPALAFAATVALAATTMAQPSGDANKEYMAVMKDMNGKMEKAMAPDPTVSFAKQMIAHHEGASQMADVLLKHSQNKDMRKMAEKMKKEQANEIKDLNSWLTKNAKGS